VADCSDTQNILAERMSVSEWDEVRGLNRFVCLDVSTGSAVIVFGRSRQSAQFLAACHLQCPIERVHASRVPSGEAS
jgi:hypothetical protein